MLIFDRGRPSERLLLLRGLFESCFISVQFLSNCAYLTRKQRKMHSSAQSDSSFLMATESQLQEDLSQESSSPLIVGGSTESRKRRLDNIGPTCEPFAPTSQFFAMNMNPAAVDVSANLNDTVMSAVLVDFEPIRSVIQVAPPKRFYRTFWRSSARRLMTQAVQMKQS